MKNLFLVGFLILPTLLLSQAPVATSPMVLFGDHLFIKLSVDGSKPLDFIFDTGDGLTVIDTDVAVSLNLPMNHSSKKTSAHGSVQGSLIAHNTLAMKGVKLEDDIQLYATSLSHLEMSIGRNIDGIIGYDLLHHYVVKIDYFDMMLKLYNPENFIFTGIGETLSFGLEKYIPHITCLVTLENGEQISGQYFVNTGAATTVDFNTKFADKNDLLDKTGEHYSYWIKGLGLDETLHYEGRVQEFQFGKAHYENLPIGISQAKRGIQGDKKIDGIIGNRILKNFSITIDYSRESMHFERHVKTTNKFEVNAAGFEVQLSNEKDKVLIRHVYEEGPARKAGLNENDHLIKINGREAHQISLPELKSMLNEDGATLELEISSYGRTRSVVLKLKDLI